MPKPIRSPRVIDTFLKTEEAKKAVTDVGVIGMSFGALQALQLAKKDKEGKLPVQAKRMSGDFAAGEVAYRRADRR